MPEASGNESSTLFRKGRDPPNVSLDEIADNLIAYFKGFTLFQHYEKEIEKKYNIEKEHDGCWPVDDIKRAWGKTQRMYESSKRRKCWSLAVIVQMMKRCSSSDEDDSESDPHEDRAIRASGETQKKRREAPDDKNIPENPPKKKHLSNDEPIYIRVPFSEMFGHKSSFSSDPSAPMERVSYKLKDKAPSLTEIKKKTSHIMQYDNRTRNAAWVYEILNRSILDENNLNKKIIKRPSFKVDLSIPKVFQTPESKKSYKNTGYERGHLAPARNHRCSKKAQVDTFLLSNIAPQHDQLNHSLWRKLENHCSEIAKKKNVRNVHVYTGPLYTSHNNKPQRVEYEFVGGKAVPTHFFKVIIEEMDDGSVKKPTCYKIPNGELGDEIKLPKKKGVSKSKKQNSQDELDEFKEDILVIERESGLIFIDQTCEEGTIDRTLTVNRTKNPKAQNVSPQIRVRISTTLSDPAGV